MNIVILDIKSIKPTANELDAFRALGALAVYPLTEPNEIVERSKEADAIITNKCIIDASIMSQLPRLRYIGVLATGYNVIDVEAAHQRGIAVTNIPAYSTMSVAQMVFAHLLNICHRVAYYNLCNRAGRWAASDDFCYHDTPLIELQGKTFGIVGMGHIGMAVARIAQAFGMKVCAYSSKPQGELPEGVCKMSLDELFAQADVLSLHCPLTERTRHLVNRERLQLMKPSAILINTGRGPLIDEEELARALNERRLAAAAMDVLGNEPPMPDNPLLHARNCYTTPHIAWATIEARRRLMHIATENLRAFMQGHPQNCV